MPTFYAGIPGDPHQKPSHQGRTLIDDELKLAAGFADRQQVSDGQLAEDVLPDFGGQLVAGIGVARRVGEVGCGWEILREGLSTVGGFYGNHRDVYESKAKM